MLFFLAVYLETYSVESLQFFDVPFSFYSIKVTMKFGIKYG